MGRLARSGLSTNNRNSSRQARKGELERTHAKAAKDANPTTFRRRVTSKGARGGRGGRGVLFCSAVAGRAHAWMFDFGVVGVTMKVM